MKKFILSSVLQSAVLSLLLYVGANLADTQAAAKTPDISSPTGAPLIHVEKLRYNKTDKKFEITFFWFVDSDHCEDATLNLAITGTTAKEVNDNLDLALKSYVEMRVGRSYSETTKVSP